MRDISPTSNDGLVHTLRRGSLLVAVLASFFVVWWLRPDATMVAVLLGVWLILPYTVLGLVIEGRLSSTTMVADSIATIAVAAGGLLFLVLVVFVNPDPQGGIAVMLTPISQALACVVLMPLARQLVRQRRIERGARD